MKDCDKTYSQRLAINKNPPEEIFLKWCENNHFKPIKFGFDENERHINKFYLLSEKLRSLPDYIVEKENKIIFIEVKGTNKVKVSDFMNYEIFYRENVEDREGIEFFIAFCFEQRTVFKNWKEIREETILNRTIKQFESDHKLYFDLKI